MADLIRTAASSLGSAAASTPKRGLVWIAPAVVLFALAWDSVYTVQQTEMAGKRRFGEVAVTQPIGPGLHMKLPFIDHIDRLQVSLTKIAITRLTVPTLDNQPVVLDLSMSLRYPARSVLKLLYEVGRAGNTDIESTIDSIAADRAQKVFARRNTISISEQRDAIGHELQSVLHADLGGLLGVEVVDTQISKIEYNPSFVQSVNAAVQAKNQAVAAENLVRQKEQEAKQRVAEAKGTAEAVVLAAEAARRQQILQAEGEAEATRLKAVAQAEAITKRGEALKSNPQIIDLVRAERWDGKLPGTMIGDTKGLGLIFDPRPGHN
jgi:regulator of protease activity HflC (stomatin/prohibitin superfamily)